MMLWYTLIHRQLGKRPYDSTGLLADALTMHSCFLHLSRTRRVRLACGDKVWAGEERHISLRDKRLWILTPHCIVSVVADGAALLRLVY